MKKVLFITLLASLMITLTPSAFALGKFRNISSISEAEVYCPLNTALTYTASNPEVNSGTIAGVNSKNMKFHSTAITARPANVNQNGVLTNASFRNSGNAQDPSYGHISGTRITCFYSYPSYTNGAPVYLSMETR